jgi:ligand-binding sensor domain-containing protein
VGDKARFRRTTIGVLILQMWMVCQALALDPQANSYLRSDFTVEEGLPDNEVNAITQTRNGFLWVGTDGDWPGLMESTSPKFVCAPESEKKFP